MGTFSAMSQCYESTRCYGNRKQGHPNPNPKQTIKKKKKKKESGLVREEVWQAQTFQEKQIFVQ